jgi:NAD(P)-dependent dehydrogenase (short-subunit alcohol dehydrogenase family)
LGLFQPRLPHRFALTAPYAEVPEDSPRFGVLPQHVVIDYGRCVISRKRLFSGNQGKILQQLLSGKVAIITGAGSGVGRAAAMVFSSHGAKVFCADIDEAAVQKTVATVRQNGGAADAAVCDVASETSVTAMTAAAVACFGRLDIMFNNAGIGSPPGGVTLTDMTPAQLDRMQAVNVQGVINGCRSAVRQFQRQGGGGVIVNTASAAGLMGWGGVAYGANKGAVIALTRSLAMEVAPHGIRVNSVCPGAMQTNFGSLSQLAGEALENMKRLHPLGRLIDAVDTANGALFLPAPRK